MNAWHSPGHQGECMTRSLQRLTDLYAHQVNLRVIWKVYSHQLLKLQWKVANKMRIVHQKKKSAAQFSPSAASRADELSSDWKFVYRLERLGGKVKHPINLWKTVFTFLYFSDYDIEKILDIWRLNLKLVIIYFNRYIYINLPLCICMCYAVRQVSGNANSGWDEDIVKYSIVWCILV